MMPSHALILCIYNLKIIAGGGPSRLFPEFMADFVAISRISYRRMLKYVAKFLHGQGFLPEDIITLTEWRVTVLAFVTPHCMKYCSQLHLLVIFTAGQYTNMSREYLAQYSSLEIAHLGTQAGTKIFVHNQLIISVDSCISYMVVQDASFNSKITYCSAKVCQCLVELHCHRSKSFCKLD